MCLHIHRRHAKATDENLKDYKNIHFPDNITVSEFNRNSALKSGQGDLFFGSIDGVIKIDPKIINLTKKSFEIDLVELVYYDDVLNWSICFFQDSNF